MTVSVGARERLARFRGRAKVGTLLVLLTLGAATTRSHAGDGKDKDEETVEAPESLLQNADARSAYDAIVKKLADARWDDAFDAASDLVTKQGSALIAVEAGEGSKHHQKAKALGLHLPVGAALRRKLAQLPKAGLAALTKRFEATGNAALDKIEASDTAALEAFADRFFPLRAGALALAQAATAYHTRGDLAAAWVANREILALHTDEASRQTAAKAMIALLPELSDPLAGQALVKLIADAKLPPSDALVASAKEAIAKLEEPELPPCSFDDSGGVAPLSSGHAPSELAQKLDLPEIPKAIDWRNEVDPQRTQFELGPCRRLLSGSTAIPGTLLVHLGKTIVAIDPETNQSSWNVGSTKSLNTYFDWLQATTTLPRYGIAIVGSTAYATLRAKLKGDEPAFPEGRIVAIDLSAGNEGQLLWDSQTSSDEAEKPKKKKSKKEEEKADKATDKAKLGDKPKKADKKAKPGDDEKEPDAKLSYSGRPVVQDGRVFVGAWNLESPAETWLVAFDQATGKLLWKTTLASSEAYTATDRNNRWVAAMPRALIAPTIGFGAGALLALSNNGCLAALDPATGRFLWAQAYERDEFAQEQPWRRTPAEDKIAAGHAPNAPLAWGQSVLTLPSDSSRMTVYSVLDGSVLGKHGRGSFEHVLGAVRDTVIFQGESEVAGYQLNAADDGTIAFESAWSQSLARAKSSGRGALVGKWAYVPGAKALTAFRASNGEKREVLTWESPKREAGDLIVGGGRFYTVSARYAHAYREEP